MGIVLLILAFVFFGQNQGRSEVGRRPQNAPNRQASPEQPCLVTLFGTDYDVSEFRNRHEGGDIFECGTDMTEQFRNEHGDDTERIFEEFGR